MPKNIPDAPGALPFIGHALQLARHRTDFLISLVEHGDLVRINMAGMPAYLPTTPELVHAILVSEQQHYVRGRLSDKMSDVLGRGLATVSGRPQREARRMLQPAFHRQKVPSYAPMMAAVAAGVADSWQPGTPIRIDDAMHVLTARVVNGMLFASDLGDAAADAIQQRLPVVMRGVLTRTLVPGAWQRLPLPANKRYRRSIDEMDRSIDDAIAAYRASGQEVDDMLSMMLALRDDDGNPMSDRWIHDQVITMAVGGVETTSAALSWSLHHIGTRPDLEERIFAEVDEVLGGRLPDASDLPALVHTGRLVLEVLRLHAVAVYMRRTLAPTRLGDYELPAGAEIILSPYALHRNRRWYPDPHRFDPDRWGTDAARNLPKGAYFPFSVGGGKCIADNFAVLEITLALAVICGRWRLRPQSDRVVREITTGATRPDRVMMIAERRTPAPVSAR
ncbi:cytochrome P450 [Lentzea sp. NPDC059081]|uniref:cytochrome P450 n=1 Tax=Lentzea sp. NPDC059081 TaxID=3346719 RepID=UPI0036B5A01B